MVIATTLDAAAAVDRALTGTVLVHGSAPPHGRDLDLLARPPQHAEISRWAEAAGLVPRRHVWAELRATPRWTLDLALTDAAAWAGCDPAVLFANAEPLEGLQHLRRPAAGVSLVLAARSLIGRRGALTAKRRARLADLLTAQPTAWTDAERIGAQLGVTGAVHALREALRGTRPATTLRRYLTGPDPMSSKAALLRAAVPLRWRPVVVAFSGLDGSGKSTQVQLLADDLERLGVRTVIQWRGYVMSSKMTRLFGLADPRWRTAAGRRELRAEPLDVMLPPAGRDGRIRPHAWAVASVLLNSLVLWADVLKHRPQTEVIVQDRFTPDNAVKLGLRVGIPTGRTLAAEQRLLAALAPIPDVGFLIDVPPDVSQARSGDDWSLEQLQQMHALYDELGARYRMRHLSGLDEPVELHRAVLDEVWRRT